MFIEQTFSYAHEMETDRPGDESSAGSESSSDGLETDLSLFLSCVDVTFIFLLLLLKVLDKGFCSHHFLQEISVPIKVPPTNRQGKKMWLKR